MDNRFDGDMCSANWVYTDEARQEAREYFGLRRGYVGVDGRFMASTDVDTLNLVFHNLTKV